MNAMSINILEHQVAVKMYAKQKQTPTQMPYTRRYMLVIEDNYATGQVMCQRPHHLPRPHGLYPTMVKMIWFELLLECTDEFHGRPNRERHRAAVPYRDQSGTSPLFQRLSMPWKVEEVRRTSPCLILKA